MFDGWVVWPQICRAHRSQYGTPVDLDMVLFLRLWTLRAARRASGRALSAGVCGNLCGRLRKVTHKGMARRTRGLTGSTRLIPQTSNQNSQDQTPQKHQRTIYPEPSGMTSDITHKATLVPTRRRLYFSVVSTCGLSRCRPVMAKRRRGELNGHRSEGRDWYRVIEPGK